MKKYSIEVIEVLSRIVEVEAENEMDATEKVRRMYRKCAIVLDDSDYKTTETVENISNTIIKKTGVKYHYLCTQLLILIISA